MSIWFDLHGIYYSHYGSDPQSVLPYLSVNTPVTLEAVENNENDKYAVAVFAEGKYIGWVPKGDLNKKIHCFLINNASYSAKIVRLYDTDNGMGATVYLYFSDNYSAFDPQSITPEPHSNPILPYHEIEFLKYLIGKNIEAPKIAKRWINDYGIIYKTTATKFIKFSLLSFSYNKNKQKVYSLTEKGQEVLNVYQELSELKMYELNYIVSAYHLRKKRSKADTIAVILEKLGVDDIALTLKYIKEARERPIEPKYQKEHPIISNQVNCNNDYTKQPHIMEEHVTVIDLPSDKSRNVDLFLCIFLGCIGAHKLYEGKYFMFILYLLTRGLFGIGWICDTFIIAANKGTDKKGNKITGKSPDKCLFGVIAFFLCCFFVFITSYMLDKH